MEEKELETVSFITQIPKGTVGLKIIATIYEGGELKTAEMNLNNAADIQDGMILGEDYESDNSNYTLIDKEE